MNNNINTLTFNNHDTYIYYVDDTQKSTQFVKLTPTNQEDTDIVNYTSEEASLFTNHINNGIIKFNSFNRIKTSSNSQTQVTVGTLITDNGILMCNFSSDTNFLGITTTDKQIKTLATYKSDKYAKYLNVEIQINFEDTYRIVTVSY